MATYDPAADRVHGGSWNSAERWGGWVWRELRYGDFFRTCSFCGCIHPDDLAAETAGTGTCTVCGKAGWPACFEGQSHAGVKAAVQAGKLDISDEERTRVLALADEHRYDPGGWYASWADQKYGWPHKMYVEGLTARDPSLPRYMGSTSGDTPPAHLADPRISQDVKDTIQRVSGLRFAWLADGRVSWEAWTEHPAVAERES